jgi:hypothetical protein
LIVEVDVLELVNKEDDSCFGMERKMIVLELEIIDEVDVSELKEEIMIECHTII